MDDLALFDDTAYRAEPPTPTPPEKISAGRRTAQIQAERLAAGVHPLAGVVGYQIRLHPDAPVADDRTAPGPRCGTCWFRRVLPHHQRSYPKCLHPGRLGADEVEKLGYPRVSNGAASDVRRWWPACVDHSPGDPSLSPDAARSVPAMEPNPNP